MITVTNVNGQQSSKRALDEGVLHTILARGFPWDVKPCDVGVFFQNIRILGGIAGITITKNGAMEARFAVCSSDDMLKALARDGRQINSRTIYGKLLHKCSFILQINSYFNCLYFSVASHESRVLRPG